MILIGFLEILGGVLGLNRGRPNYTQLNEPLSDEEIKALAMSMPTPPEPVDTRPAEFLGGIGGFLANASGPKPATVGSPSEWAATAEAQTQPMDDGSDLDAMTLAQQELERSRRRRNTGGY